MLGRCIFLILIHSVLHGSSLESRERIRVHMQEIGDIFLFNLAENSGILT